MNDITIEWQGQVVEVTATLVIGSGGVDSVTGYSVDNTDVKNPIVNAVPLSGTEGGSPVTGNIEISDSAKINFTNSAGQNARLYSSTGSLFLDSNIIFIGKASTFQFFKFTPLGDGLSSTIDYSSFTTGGLISDRKIYAQRSYVDDTKNIGKTFENLTATGAINIDVSLYDSIKLHLTGNTTLTFINTPTGTSTKAINMVVTTENGTETLGLSSATNYYYAGEFDAAIRNVFAINFSSYTTSGLEVDVFINETTNEPPNDKVLLINDKVTNINGKTITI